MVGVGSLRIRRAAAMADVVVCTIILRGSDFSLRIGGQDLGTTLTHAKISGFRRRRETRAPFGKGASGV